MLAYMIHDGSLVPEIADAEGFRIAMVVAGLFLILTQFV